MLGQLGHLPRLFRLTIIVTFLVVVPTLYFLHRTPEYVPSPGDVQAGGIDSDHWRKPITPHLEEYDTASKEEVREWDEQSPLDRGQGDGKEQSHKHDAGSTSSWGGVSKDTLAGGVIMPKLGNETAKAELGRSAWRVLHLMTLRYPDEPTEDDRQALKSYFYLFSRLYPCGECATEFQQLLKQYPPQTSSRKSASLWLCHVHNLVNARLGKDEFDCLTLDATYDCGCGDESVSATASSGGKPKETGKRIAGSEGMENEVVRDEAADHENGLEREAGEVVAPHHGRPASNHVAYGQGGSDESERSGKEVEVPWVEESPAVHGYGVHVAANILPEDEEAEGDEQALDEGEAPTHDRAEIDDLSGPNRHRGSSAQNSDQVDAEGDDVVLGGGRKAMAEAEGDDGEVEWGSPSSHDGANWSHGDADW